MKTLGVSLLIGVTIGLVAFVGFMMFKPDLPYEGTFIGHGEGFDAHFFYTLQVNADNTLIWRVKEVLRSGRDREHIWKGSFKYEFGKSTGLGIRGVVMSANERYKYPGMYNIWLDFDRGENCWKSIFYMDLPSAFEGDNVVLMKYR